MKAPYFSYSISIAAITLLASAPINATKEPVRLQPTSKWEMEYKEDSCRLARKFGLEDQSVILIFDKYQPGEQFKLSLAGKSVRLTDETRILKVRFGPGEAEQSLSFYSGDFGADMPAVFVLKNIRIAPPTKAELKADKNADFDKQADFAPIEAARTAAVTEVSIGNPLRKPVILETGSLQRAFDAMEKCTDDLLTGWGIDAVKHKNLKQAAKPKNNPGYWLTSKDYPRKMLAKGARSIVNFRLSVDPAGLPTACAIQGSTREVVFDEVVCKGLIKHARFNPALAADGTAIASYYINTVRFALP